MIKEAKGTAGRGGGVRDCYHLPLHSHIKVTDKLQNKRHSEPPGPWGDGSNTEREGAETLNERVPHTRVGVTNGEGHLGCQGPPEERGIPTPQPRAPVLGRDVPITSGHENQRGWKVSENRTPGVPGTPLKGPAHGLSLTQSL